MPGNRIVSAAGLVLLLAGCKSEDDADRDVVRGRGLQPAALPAATAAQVYEGALRAAYDIGPSLSLLLDSRLLPRTAGLAGGAAMPEGTASALRRRGVVQGTCEPPNADSVRGTPHCEARLPGYVVRFSDVFSLGPDSVQVHLMSQRYATATSGAAEALRFERIYQLAKRGGRWRVVREARMPDAAQ